MDKSWMLGFFRMNYFTFMKKWNKIELEYKIRQEYVSKMKGYERD